VCHGKVCFRGTRILVSTVLDELSAGMTPEGLKRHYPTLAAEAVPAALAYAADVARERVVDIPA